MCRMQSVSSKRPYSRIVPHPHPDTSESYGKREARAEAPSTDWTGRSRPTHHVPHSPSICPPTHSQPSSSQVALGPHAAQQSSLGLTVPSLALSATIRIMGDSEMRLAAWSLGFRASSGGGVGPSAGRLRANRLRVVVSLRTASVHDDNGGGKAGHCVGSAVLRLWQRSSSASERVREERMRVIASSTQRTGGMAWKSSVAQPRVDFPQEER